MEEHVGEEFDGIVASVVKFGMFVELPNTIEGLIHVTSLPEYVHYNERTMVLQGEKSGKVFKVGQPIRVKLVKADKETGDIDFEYLPSDFDIVEKIEKSDRRKGNARRGTQSSKDKQGRKKMEHLKMLNKARKNHFTKMLPKRNKEKGVSNGKRRR